MINPKNTARALMLSLACGVQMANAVHAAPARPDRFAARAMYLDAARAGSRVVAVGERGHVLLTDDGGHTPHQALQVPVDTTLTAVSFADARHGWAVGHGGVIVHTDDGGERWTLQRQDKSVDQPLLTVYFRDRLNGWAAGLWSLLLVTRDGGTSWHRVALPPQEGAKRSDLNLLKIFPGPDGQIYIAAERGMVLASADDGSTWRYRDTGGKASLWTGSATGSGALLVGGLGGKLLRSSDRGATWSAIDTGTTASITQLRADAAGITASALDGRLQRSEDDGRTWSPMVPGDVALTAIASDGRGGYLRFSRAGLLR
ncbi:MAG: YCF48-related protein [Pseudomonadota bacterium]|nr:YCF48-related protein [Pseudomonadota bacterium]